jgi:hypothetical protein
MERLVDEGLIPQLSAERLFDLGVVGALRFSNQSLDRNITESGAVIGEQTHQLT